MEIDKLRQLEALLKEYKEKEDDTELYIHNAWLAVMDKLDDVDPAFN